MNEVLPSTDFRTELDQFKAIISDWRTEAENCLKRRDLRQNKKSVHDLQQQGILAKDETIIPDHTISSNIRRAKTPFTNYISKSKRILIINDIDSPQISIQPLEEWFTRGMRYPGWKRPWFKLIDAFHVHGGAAIEVVYDEDNPLKCGLEYIPRAELMFSRKTRDLQACPRILRKYEITIQQLEEFTQKYGFDQTITSELFDKFDKSITTTTIYRALMKIGGVVNNAWFSEKVDKDWLRPPRPHDIGLFQIDHSLAMQPVPASPVPVPPPGYGASGQMPPGQMDMSMNMNQQMIPLFISPQWAQASGSPRPSLLSAYPTFWFPFQETEVDEILEEQGRVSLDLHVQEAMMRLLTNTVNATTRASNCYPCAQNEPGGDPDLKEIGPIKPNVIMSRQLTFNQFPWPNAIILAVMQALKIGKADESGQSDFAATARKDANKTAKEMELATEQSNLVISSDLDVFSSPYLEVYALCFNIACHQAIYNFVKRPIHPELLIGDYNLQSASDIEVVKRDEDKQNAIQFFNIVKGTPAAEKILKFLIQRFFPDQADEWIQELSQPDMKSLIIQLVNIIKQIPTDELAPEQQLALRNIVATAQQMVGEPVDSSVPQQPGNPQGQASQPSNANQQVA